MNNKINKKLVNKINSLLDKGVTSGLSKDPKPGEMCVEQVICYALGEEITDRPSCVDEEVRWFVISLNDRNWSSPSARAEGMRELSIAQLGSKFLNQWEFLDKLSFRLITKLLPAMFRALGEEKWEKEIKSLEKAKDLKKAKKAAAKIASVIDVDSDTIAAARATRDTYYAVHYIACGAYAASYAADATKTGDKYLKMVAHLGVEVLKDMKSPGCQFIGCQFI